MLIQVLAFGSIAWLAWQVLRNHFIKSPLDNLPGPPPASWLRGHLGQLFDRHGWKFQDEIGENYGPVVKLQSLFGRKAIFTYDPRALHQVVIKEPYTYEPSEWFIGPIRLILGPGVFVTYGDLHRRQRKMLNPVFSIKHMRYMTPLFFRVAERLRDGIKNHLKSHSDDDVDILHWMHRTALELIGQGGLGHSFDSLETDAPYNDFTKGMKDLSPTLFNSPMERMAAPFLAKLGPAWFRRMLLDLVPNQRVQRLKDISDVMCANTRRIFFGKKAAFEAGDEAVKEQVASGKDIMSILLNANTDAAEEDKLTEEELLGQMSILLFAATDTTTSALSQILQLLAENPDAQEKVRTEIKEAQTKAGGEIPHDELMALPYLDAICRETLRLFPPLTFITREARKDAVMPLSKPVRGQDGQLMSEVHVPKGTTVVVGIRASNLNRSIWGEDVREWKPERWLGRIPEAVTEARLPGVYSNLMTFNGGSRSCVGFKFSQLEMKVVLVVLLTSFKFSMSEKSKEVVWNMAGIRYPTVGKVSGHAEFPMKLTPIED